MSPRNLSDASHFCEENSNEITTAALNIALHNFKWRILTYVFFNATFLCNLNIFLKTYNKGVVVGNGLVEPRIDGKIQQLVLFCDDIVGITLALNSLPNQFDETGKVIVICQSPISWKCSAEEAMRSFWSVKITNVVFLKKDVFVMAYTYMPVYNEQCEISDPIPLFGLKPCIINATKCGVFDKKLDNLNKCKIVVSTLIRRPFMIINNGIPEGADGDLLLLIMERLNATLEVIIPGDHNYWGKLDSNGTWSGSLGDVYYGAADISMTSAALTASIISYFKISIPYRSTNVVWISHPPKALSPALKLLHPFKPSTQIALGIIFFIVIACVLFVSSKKMWLLCCRRVRTTKKKTSLLFNTWMICIGVPIAHLPSTSTFLSLIVLWIWYCFLIRTFYQVWLINSLQGKFYLDGFEKIDEAIEAGYDIGGGIFLKEYFVDYPYIYNNWKETVSLNVTLHEISEGSNFIAATIYDLAKSLTNFEKINVHFLAEKVVVSPSVLFFNKNSPLVAPINELLQQLTESGFVEKISRNYFTHNVVKNPTQIREPIDIENYTGCYMVLLGGWIISILCCMAEICFRKIFNKF
uniref:Uncharacterized protein n=2 Tax=Bombyx mori TaxID=7091 RepID=A0A8R1WL68_BOMMO|nr:uncharacterized protein LOC101735593 [Bombyx mori]